MERPAGDPALWWQRGVVYQIYPRSFADASGDGVGDLPGVIDRLDYLSDTLGVEAIWLSPFYRSPMRDFGYDISDHTDVDPLFGDLGDFDRLVSEAHRRGLKVIVDYVPNHTSIDHRWFVESRAARDAGKRDWYFWRDPRPDGSEPNNWISIFGGPAWALDERTGQYYLHLFDESMPDVNWREPAARRAMLDVIRFWLDRGVDGFRIDVAHLIMKDPQLRDNPPNPHAGRGDFHKALGDYDTQLHVYDKAHPDVHGVYRELREMVDGHDRSRARVTIGEIHEYDWTTWASYYGETLDELHMPFNFVLLNTEWTAAGVRAAVAGLEAALPEGAWANWVVGNHDEPRVATRMGACGARLAMMLLLTLRGTPTIYNGDELGLENVEVPPGLVRDPMELLRPGLGLGRDPARGPLPWTSGPGAGFSSSPEAEPWLPLPAGAERLSVEAQLRDPRSMLSLTRRLLAVRRTSPALEVGAYRELEDTTEDCFCFVREEGGARVLVALNFGGGGRTLDLRALGSGAIAVSTGMDRDGAADLTRLSLSAQEGLVVELGA